MSTTLQYASFLVRLWREADAGTPGPPVAWCGEVEHIQSGQRWTFGTVDELLAFLRRQADGSEVSEQRGDERASDRRGSEKVEREP